MSHTEIWLVLKADSISAMFASTALILGIMVGVYNFVIFLIWLFAEERIKRGVKRANIILVSLLVFCGLSFSLFPTTTELVKIHVIPILLSKNSIDEIKKFPPKLLKLLNVSVDSLSDYISKGKGK